jgi:hypothetical protein
VGYDVTLNNIVVRFRNKETTQRYTRRKMYIMDRLKFRNCLSVKEAYFHYK